MKNLFSLLLLFCTINLFAQEVDRFTENNSDRPRDIRADQMNFVPSEVLVKFKDEVNLAPGTNLKSAGISAVDQVLKANGAGTLEKLFPTAKKLKSAKFVKDPQGRDMKIPKLDNIYKVTIPQLKSTGSTPANIYKFIEELKALTEVEYAEPNYICTIDNLKPVGPVLSAEDVTKLKKDNLKDAPLGIIPNDPLYNQQAYIPAVKADLVWAQTMGDTTQVIAILDTGVDWNHPDLKNKIWKNRTEIPNNGIDDDGNGLADDIRGWDYINNDNNPMDDNSHGTHVAGIAAAETNNGIGIAGICPKAKILPVKVFASDGHGDVATITKGILYAMQRGAIVINMSFGTYWRSFTMDNALLNAYSSATLVASAGNDSKDIYAFTGQPWTSYPAALPYVLGVRSDGNYSNFDSDGPIFSRSEEGINYELIAPGSIMSTVPGGGYRMMSGTSMAAPVISGAASLYQSYYPQNSREDLWGDFIHSSSNIINLEKVFFETTKTPMLDLVSSSITDTSMVSNDKDNQADAGETLDIAVKVRNTWAPAHNVYIKLAYNINSTTTDIEIINDSVFIGSIGVYGQKDNRMNPFKIKIKPGCFHNRNITMDVIMKNVGDTTIFRQPINFVVYNASELSGILMRDTTLTPDKNWAINNSLRIATGVTVTILPGTHVDINSAVDNRGILRSIGTADSLIYFKGSIGGNCIYKYVDFDLKGGSISGKSFDNCIIKNGGSSNQPVTLQVDTLNNCYIENYYSDHAFSQTLIKNSLIKNSLIWVFETVFDRCLIDNVRTASSSNNLRGSTYTIFNNIGDIYSYYYPNQPQFWRTEIMTSSLDKLKKNSFLENGKNLYFAQSTGSSDIQNFPEQYWGTSNKAKIKKKYIDFNNNAGLPYLIIDPILSAPSDSCHGHVWKVLVNGKDAQDEVVDPLGIGKQRFDVYFNRPMDKNILPVVTFGVKSPYKQETVNENGSWSEDGKIYTLYKTIKLTSTDGINRIRVAGAKEINGWNWEIPVEDSRFEFVINAARSASLEFMASPGLGNVKMEWNNNTLVDGLGFNMYRMEHVNDSVLTSPVLINATLITDTLYTDFAVTPNKKYYYYYKILRTNLSETDSSKVVSAIPFTASKGDANGDLNVNVLDITTIVAYLIKNNPQPFITEAADYNSDESINVLDIVGVVNQIVNGGKKSAEIGLNQQVHLYMKNDTLFADAPVAIGGIQFDINKTTSIDDIQKLKALEGFESGYSQQQDGLRLLYFSMSGKSIPAGDRIPLLKMKKGSAIAEAIFADKTGLSIAVDFTVTAIGKMLDNPKKLVAELGQNFPNPFSNLTTIPYLIFEPVDEAVIRIFNIAGQELKIMRLANPIVGEHLLQWDSGVHKGLFVYQLEVRQGKKQFVCPARKMIVQ